MVFCQLIRTFKWKIIVPERGRRGLFGYQIREILVLPGSIPMFRGVWYIYRRVVCEQKPTLSTLT
jgi:hypothetical protein